MITTSQHSSPHIVTDFSLVMRTLNIYSLSNFQICTIVLLTVVTMPYITPLELILQVEVCTF